MVRILAAATIHHADGAAGTTAIAIAASSSAAAPSEVAALGEETRQAADAPGSRAGETSPHGLHGVAAHAGRIDAGDAVGGSDASIPPRGRCAAVLVRWTAAAIIDAIPGTEHLIRELDPIPLIRRSVPPERLQIAVLLLAGHPPLIEILHVPRPRAVIAVPSVGVEVGAVFGTVVHGGGGAAAAAAVAAVTVIAADGGFGDGVGVPARRVGGRSSSAMLVILEGGYGGTLGIHARGIVAALRLLLLLRIAIRIRRRKELIEGRSAGAAVAAAGGRAAVAVGDLGPVRVGLDGLSYGGCRDGFFAVEVDVTASVDVHVVDAVAAPAAASVTAVTVHAAGSEQAAAVALSSFSFGRIAGGGVGFAAQAGGLEVRRCRGWIGHDSFSLLVLLV
mmetsp:Transcript_34935/g.73692  ORF Transcript_34935/g.73692 Transcript_34935/m.73692 type:complete len:391 (-) Transcript_34935:334-1506(-)